MQRPAWSTIVAILMILIGIFGSINDLKQINIEELLEFQDDLIEEMYEEFVPDPVETAEDQQPGDPIPDTIQGKPQTTTTMDDIRDTIEDISRISPGAMAKLRKEGYIGLPISVLFLITGILFFYVRKNMVAICYGVLSLGLFYTVYQLWTITDMNISDLLRAGLYFNLSFGIFCSLAVIIILWISDKSYYHEGQEIEDYFDK